MSIERAIRFCELCHQHNKEAKVKERDFANSQAMQAIEETISLCKGPPLVHYFLTACRNCDYKEARMVRLSGVPIGKEWRDLRKKWGI